MLHWNCWLIAIVIQGVLLLDCKSKWIGLEAGLNVEMVWHSQVPLCQLWSWQLSRDQLVGSVSHWSSPEELKSCCSQCLDFWILQRILKQCRGCSFQEFESLHLLTFMSCIICKNSFQPFFFAKIGVDIYNWVQKERAGKAAACKNCIQ